MQLTNRQVDPLAHVDFTREGLVGVHVQVTRIPDFELILPHSNFVGALLLGLVLREALMLESNLPRVLSVLGCLNDCTIQIVVARAEEATLTLWKKLLDARLFPLAEIGWFDPAIGKWTGSVCGRPDGDFSGRMSRERLDRIEIEARAKIDQVVESQEMLRNGFKASNG